MLTFLVYFVREYSVNIPFLLVFCMMSLGLINDSAWINDYCAVGFTYKDNTIINKKQTNFLGLFIGRRAASCASQTLLDSLHSFGSV